MVTLAPQHAEANLNLGILLMAEGETESARRHLRQAAQSPNTAVRQAAEDALRELDK